MTNTNVTNFRKDIYEMLKMAIKYNEPINVSTKDGNVVIMSEQDYNSIMETLYIESMPGLKEDILEGMKEPLDEFVSEEEVEW